MTGTSYRVPHNADDPRRQGRRREHRSSNPCPSARSSPARRTARAAPAAEGELRGAAWAGDITVRRVDVSIDFGATLDRRRRSATTQPLRLAALDATLDLPSDGYYEIWSRATDSTGRCSPRRREQLEPGRAMAATRCTASRWSSARRRGPTRRRPSSRAREPARRPATPPRPPRRLDPARWRRGARSWPRTSRPAPGARATTAAAPSPGRRARSPPLSSRPSRSGRATQSAAGATSVLSPAPSQSLPCADPFDASAWPAESWLVRASSPRSCHHASGLPPPPSIVIAHSTPTRASSGRSPRFWSEIRCWSAGSRRPPTSRTSVSARTASGPSGRRTVADRATRGRHARAAARAERTIGKIGQIAAPAGAPRLRRRVRGQDANEPAAALVVVVDEARREPRLLHLDNVVDRGRCVARRLATALPRGRRVVLAQGLVVRLRPAAHHATRARAATRAGPTRRCPAPSARSTSTIWPSVARRTSSRPSRSRSSISLALAAASADPPGPRRRSARRASPCACGRGRCRRTGRASSSRSTGRGRGGRARPRVRRRPASGRPSSETRSICLCRSLISR